MEKRDEDVFGSGEKSAETITTLWNAQPNPPKIYAGGYRIHHYGLGLLSITLGFLMAGLGNRDEMTTGEFLAGFGTGLLVDDANDFLDDLRKGITNNSHVM